VRRLHVAGACQKALAGLRANAIEFEFEFESYRAGNYKAKLATMTDAQAFAALAADDKLIKRPLALGGGIRADRLRGSGVARSAALTDAAGWTSVPGGDATVTQALATPPSPRTPAHPAGNVSYGVTVSTTPLSSAPLVGPLSCGTMKVHDPATPAAST